MFDGNGTGVTMPVAPIGYGGYGGYGNDGFGFGGTWGGLLLGLLFGGLGGWGGFGGFGGGWGNMMGMDALALAPYFFNTQTQNDVNRGFDTQNLGNQISAVQGSVENVRTQGQLSDIQSAINNGFANAEVAGCNRSMDAMQTAYNNQIASMNQNFANQQALDARLGSMEMAQQKCCCDNQLATAQTQSIVQSEAAENRFQALNNTQNIIANGKSDTQAILDKLCQLELDGVKSQLDTERRENVSLQNQLNMATMQASQVAQTAQLMQDNNAQTAALIQRIAPYPQPSFLVGNPYVSYPYYNNGYNNNGCGCNGFA